MYPRIVMASFIAPARFGSRSGVPDDMAFSDTVRLPRNSGHGLCSLVETSQR